MKASDMVLNDVTVVVDEYSTGEVLYEGPVRGDYIMGMWCSDFPKSVEWALKDGKPIAFVTISFGEKLDEYKRMRAAEAAHEAFVSEPVYKSLNAEERDALRAERRPEEKRLWREYCVAKSAFEGWELIEE